MLIGLRDMLAERDRGVAVGAFTCYDVTTAIAVLRAAEARGTQVILLVSQSSYVDPDGPALVSALGAVARRSTVPVCLQLDHVADQAVIARAVRDGVTAVMADGSRLATDENVAFSEHVRAVTPNGVGMEVELGHIEGGEDVAAAVEAGALTDPVEAAAFVARVRPDCLAVSIGNVHGAYASPPRLDWERLVQIRDAVDPIPLSLHGASGLPDHDVRHAVSLGIAKVNVNTEIRMRYLEELATRLPDVTQGFRLQELHSSVVDAVAEVVAAKLDLLLDGRAPVRSD